MSGFGRKKRHLYWSSTMNSLLDPFLYQLKHFLIISPLMVQMIQLISVISQNMFFLIFHINYVQTSL